MSAERTKGPQQLNGGRYTKAGRGPQRTGRVKRGQFDQFANTFPSRIEQLTPETVALPVAVNVWPLRPFQTLGLPLSVPMTMSALQL
jgi:hypothetical protein